jgi:flagellar biosynthesis regulator FlaF
MPERIAEFAWLLMPLAVAAGASIVTGFLMRARAEVDSARQRQLLAEARTLLGAAQRILEDRVEAAEASARRKALDEFLADVRIEERRYPRERRPSVIVLERVCFRNIPLTPWFEHEIPGVREIPVRSPAVEVFEAPRTGQRLLA